MLRVVTEEENLIADSYDRRPRIERKGTVELPHERRTIRRSIGAPKTVGTKVRIRKEEECSTHLRVPGRKDPVRDLDESGFRAVGRPERQIGGSAAADEDEPAADSR